MPEGCIDDRFIFQYIDWTKGLDENVDAIREFLMRDGTRTREEVDTFLEERIKKIKGKDAV